MLSDEEISKHEIKGKMNEPFWDITGLLQAQEQATRKEIAKWLIGKRTTWGNYPEAKVELTIKVQDLEDLSKGEMPKEE
uniref:Uncharacterized protein n=1 Tax=viral metagenome TaxID=1070528 RepID=A0A6M3LJM1_9ZZZZ